MVTAISNKAPYLTELSSGSHQLMADEAVESGGQDAGPSPTQFLQMALASCTAITVRMYANRKNWALTAIKVDVDSTKMEGKTLFKRQVFLDGNLTEDQKQRLLQVANACPIHKTLTNPIEIETRLV